MTQDDVRRIALSLPEAVEEPDRFAFGVRGKHFVWVWLERTEPKKGRVPNPTVVAVRVANAMEKEDLLATDREVFFTEPHYNGYPAVMVRLPTVAPDVLEQLIVEAWRCRAPKRLVAVYDAGRQSRI